MKNNRLNFRASDFEVETIEKAAKLHSDITGQSETISSTIIQATAEFASHASNKILIDDHKAEALDFIERLELNYVPAVDSIRTSIKRLGFSEVSKDLLHETMIGKFDLLEHEASKIARGFVQSNPSSAGRYQEQIASMNLFHEVRECISKALENPFDDRTIRESDYFEHLSFNEDGMPFISEATKSEILESYKVFIISRKAASIYKAHLKAAQALQEFLTSIKDTRLRKALSIGNPWNTISSLFEISGNEGKFTIEARKINYNLLFVETEEETEE